MKITQVDRDGTYKMGTLYDLTLAQIQKALGFEPEDESTDGKVRWFFAFDVEDGEEDHFCAIWDWKGSADSDEWSYFGPRHIIDKVLGR